MGRKVIAVDTGNRFIKTVNAEPFSAGINRHGSSMPGVAVDSLLFDGEYYSFSENQNGYRKDKTVDINYFILTLAAIGRELIMKNAISKARSLGTGEKYISFADEMRKAAQQGGVIEEEIVLGVGLPPAHYSELSESFKNYFTSYGNPIQFRYNNIDFNITIEDVYVLVQGFSAVMTRDNMDKIKGETQVYVIDIGGQTTDLGIFRDGKISLDIYGSYPKGVIPLFHKISNVLREKHQIEDISPIHIEAVLKDGKSIGKKEVEDTIIKITDEYAEELLRYLADNGFLFDLNLPVFVGGGALLMKKSIMKVIRSGRPPVFINDVKANAIGYEQYLYKYLNSINKK